MTKFYADQQGRYLGGFDGAAAQLKVPEGAREVPSPPAHAADLYDGARWVPNDGVKAKAQIEKLEAGQTATPRLLREIALQVLPADHPERAKLASIEAAVAAERAKLT